MNKVQASNLIIELMDLSEACYLTTIDQDNFPQTRAMLNLRNLSQYPKLIPFFNAHNDDFGVYFTTNTSSQKVAQIKNNPRVSVYYSKPSEWRGLMLGGNIKIVGDPDLKKRIWQDNWTMYYQKGPVDDDYTILELKPRVLKLYHQLDLFTIQRD